MTETLLRDLVDTSEQLLHDEEEEAIVTTASAQHRVAGLYDIAREGVYRRCDRVFAWLMVVQLGVAIGLALWLSPRAWAGTSSSIHPHVITAIVVGGALTLAVWMMTRAYPGRAITRHVIAVAQMLYAALLIHVTGGRIETHFHIFGSLAFLAYYRDIRVLITATVVVAAEHALRGMLIPMSIYGTTDPQWWRFVEHALWVVFEDAVLVMGILGNHREMRELAERQAGLAAMAETIEHKVVIRTRALQVSREQFRQLVESVQVTPYQLLANTWQLTYAGPQGARLLGCARRDWLERGFWDARIHPDDRAAWFDHLRRAATGVSHEAEVRLRHGSGQWVSVRSMARGDLNGLVPVVRGVLIDVTEQRRLELELRQAQKLESVGRLASGVAHEINTPVQFVADSVTFIREAFTDVLTVNRAHQAIRDACVAGSDPVDHLAAVADAEATADLPYLTTEVPRALERCVDGLERIATLVRSMKEFAHPDCKEKVPADLNHALETTLTMARNEYKYVADVELDLQPLPAVTCHVSELNQVFLNLIVNAAHAITDVVGAAGGRGTIKITTRDLGDRVSIAISDSGRGIPDHVKARIFEPFFTTKEVGKGTGQGLAIARSAVVDKHGGTIGFESTIGQGTTFTIAIPVEASARVAA